MKTAMQILKDRLIVDKKVFPDVKSGIQHTQFLSSLNSS